jgi:hypothetical protein
MMNQALVAPLMLAASLFSPIVSGPSLGYEIVRRYAAIHKKCSLGNPATTGQWVG